MKYRRITDDTAAPEPLKVLAEFVVRCACCRLIALLGVAEPSDSSFGTALDCRHHLDLMAALIDVVLVYADLIDPHP